VNASDGARNLAWKLNWWRQSELEGSLLLGRLVGLVEDGDLARRLTKHCAEEAEHSRIWAAVIGELQLPHVRIFRSYQSFYLRHSGPPATLLDVLCFTQIFERRVHTRFHAESQSPDTPTAARAAYRRMIEDEKDHLAWVAEWLSDQSGADERLESYRAIDRAVFAEIEPFTSRLWEIPKLGRESPLQAISTLENNQWPSR
jgi:rubrerythrin